MAPFTSNENKTQTLQSSQSMIYKTRKEEIPPEPTTRALIAFDGQWSKTISGADFVLCDSSGDDRIIIFASVNFFIRICNADIVYMDGTFTCCPKLFTQLYTLHVTVCGQMFPALYALLPDKRKETYSRFFNMISAKATQLGLQFNPPIFQIDFENAVVSILREIYPQSRIRGCLFHFSQAIWQNEQVHKLVRRLCAMPLLNPSHLGNAWIDVENDAPRNLLDYFVATWLDDNPPAMFPQDLWNHFDNDGPRTTNHLEGFHNALNRALKIAHPNFFVFLQLIRSWQNSEEQNLNALMNGAKPKRQRKKYTDIHMQLMNLRSAYVNGDIEALDFLTRCGFQMHLSDA
ncbi:uncharacterized protein B4U80_06769 [Leptotrombidium deliense]|uniref:MULE transposase domain-containing protein n=1 Tax=Leptotrombidium deliense TaxID=299467 RepID=A0A443S3L2_9ACAR|nr:uncharacterized protein B4U80_06769 [Leptotrombidium deliense]